MIVLYSSGSAFFHPNRTTSRNQMQRIQRQNRVNKQSPTIAEVDSGFDVGSAQKRRSRGLTIHIIHKIVYRKYGSVTMKTRSASSSPSIGYLTRWCFTPPKPKAPLSAYNLYFQLERKRILDDQTDWNGIPVTWAEIHEVACTHKRNTGKKRVHRKSHGKIGFVELARTIGKRWKLLDPESRRLLEEYNSVEKAEHLKSFNAWKARQVRTTDSSQGAQEADFSHLLISPSPVDDGVSRKKSSKPKRVMVSPAGELLTTNAQLFPQYQHSKQQSAGVLGTPRSQTSFGVLATTTTLEDPLTFLCPSISNSVLQGIFENFDSEMDVKEERAWSTWRRHDDYKGHPQTKHDNQVPQDMFCNVQTLKDCLAMDPDVDMSPQEMDTLFDDDDGDERKSHKGVSPVSFPNEPWLVHKIPFSADSMYFV